MKYYYSVQQLETFGRCTQILIVKERNGCSYSFLSDLERETDSTSNKRKKEEKKKKEPMLLTEFSDQSVGKQKQQN